MAAKFYSVTFDPTVNVGLRDGVAAAVVVAESAADAKAACKALYGNDVDAGWDNASVVEIAAGTDLSGWSLHVDVELDGVVKANITVVGDDTNNTIDEIAALAVTALNATAAIANSAYNSGTQVLTIASAADNLGASQVNVALSPPGSIVPIPGFVTATVDGGVTAAALTATFAADAYSVPSLTAKFKEKK